MHCEYRSAAGLPKRRNPAPAPRAFAVIGLCARCIQRWRSDDVDARSTRVQTCANAFSAAEAAAVLATVNAPEHVHLPPTQIVPMLADHNVNIGSESSVYRILLRGRQLAHRRTEPAATARPRAGSGGHAGHYLSAEVRGQCFYVYVVLDSFSRYAVAWQVYPRESHPSRRGPSLLPRGGRSLRSRR